MALVSVSATGSLRCQRTTGRRTFYYERINVSVIAEEQLDNQAYAPALYAQASSEGLIPDNCTGQSWSIDSVTPVPGGTGQQFTTYIEVYCFNDAGKRWGPFTQRFDFPVAGDASAFEAEAKRVADEFCRNFAADHIDYRITRSEHILLAPAYYQYQRE